MLTRVKIYIYSEQKGRLSQTCRASVGALRASGVNPGGVLGSGPHQLFPLHIGGP